MKIARRAPSRVGRLLDEPLALGGFAPRRLRVYLPAGHDERDLRPLLVLFDGQNVFDHASSFSGGWLAHEAVERLARRRPHPIVVGVEHGEEARLSELSPWPVKGQPGRAREFVGALARDVVPALRRRFRIVDGPLGVLLGGSSMGGLAATYGHLTHPESFGGALAMSPSFWVGATRLLSLVQTCPAPPVSQIYLDCGRAEGDGELAPLVERVASALRARGWGDDRLCLRVDPRGAHSESSWRRRLVPALRWFYRAG
ncbi:MAG: alpha/beta hydrolase [Polyangiaceae bacterium]|nr:alpha/beta hydrolase [Polyangiaceae bacterium]